MIGFELGREYKLSLAEIFSIFPEGKIVFVTEKILILEGIEGEDIHRIGEKLGGSIKILSIEKVFSEKNFSSLREICLANLEGKRDFGVSFFGDDQKNNLKTFLLGLKKEGKTMGFKTRFVNTNFINTSSAQILGEKLVETKTDFNFIFTKNKVFFGKTLWVQDINAYTKRDMEKQRDMETGMLPPKLAQIMINLVGSSEKNISIYDPFCGLGTILTESLLMGNKEVFGSDINKEMVQKTKDNITFIEDTFGKKSNKAIIFEQDATKISDINILKTEKIHAIISEGYLGEIFTQDTITEEQVEKQRKNLTFLYKDFFSGLKKVGFKGTIVMSFPFWEIRRTYFYFEEVYTIIDSFCKKEKMLLENHIARESKTGSLLYKRPNQTVGREVFKLKLK